MSKRQEINEFYKLNRNYLINDINSIILNHTEAEDILHDAILKYLQYTKQKGYTEKISYSNILRLCKIIARKNISRGDILSDNNIIVNDPLDLVINAENISILINQINSLKDIYKRVLIKFYLDNEPIKVIAEDINIRIDTVSKRLQRGREMLRQNLNANY